MYSRGAAPGSEKGVAKGLVGLINMQKKPMSNEFAGIKENFFVDPNKDYNQYKGEGTVAFYRLNEKNPNVVSASETYQGSKHTWDRIFKGENDKTSYSFEPHNRGKGDAKLKGTDFKASKEQTDNLRAHEAKTMEGKSCKHGVLPTDG